MLDLSSSFVWPRNGRYKNRQHLLRRATTVHTLPMSISKMHTPNECQSTLALYARLLRTSGAMYAMLPATPLRLPDDGMCTAMLKSVKWA